MADDIEHAARHYVASSAIAYARYLTHAGQCGNGTHPHLPRLVRGSVASLRYGGRRSVGS